MKLKKNWSFLSSLIVAGFLLYSGAVTFNPNTLKFEKKAVPSPTAPKKLNSFFEVRVTSVIDGDTIIIEGNKHVRYIGIDTPETKHPAKGVQCYGLEASQKNKELVDGKLIRMQKDVSETDRYGRLLRYVWIVNENATDSAGLFVNDYLVREGYAVASTFPPDVMYSKQFIEAARVAREENKGLWKSCN
ncbi:YHYH domain-containing protein [Candidatus Roizmanbacteria bacterium CG_4_10_14_0_8_um_filter_39_9]|uniref:YHYH domain-containing protein n=1 Tax=Candidatus Roizmanbacteria bacterium CG_4_10_14_0_8_um_filter_39_9 TaxID=1974829 RepID=A0A2M7QF70_9BACT|nr:MAG: YHYH domain-containing protein [Candidatus Roizmanbacteria bacterium CG_4_10_14_0_8_um_filter_39_9]